MAKSDELLSIVRTVLNKYDIVYQKKKYGKTQFAFLEYCVFYKRNKIIILIGWIHTNNNARFRMMLYDKLLYQLKNNNFVFDNHHFFHEDYKYVNESMFETVPGSYVYTTDIRTPISSSEARRSRTNKRKTNNRIIRSPKLIVDTFAELVEDIEKKLTLHEPVDDLMNTLFSIMFRIPLKNVLDLVLNKPITSFFKILMENLNRDLFSFFIRDTIDINIVLQNHIKISIYLKPLLITLYETFKNVLSNPTPQELQIFMYFSSLTDLFTSLVLFSHIYKTPHQSSLYIIGYGQAHIENLKGVFKAYTSKGKCRLFANTPTFSSRFTNDTTRITVDITT
jgi:hypothetical protein